MRSPCLKGKVHLSGEIKSGHPKCEICDDRWAYVAFIENREHDFPVVKMGGKTMTENNATYGETTPAPEAPEAVATKVCRRCKQGKPLAGFSKHPQTKDGYDATCKACKNELAKEWHRARKTEAMPLNQVCKKPAVPAKAPAKAPADLSYPTDRTDPTDPSDQTQPKKMLTLDFTDSPEIFDNMTVLSRKMIRPLDRQAIFMIREYMEAFGELGDMLNQKGMVSKMIKAAQ